MNKKKIFTILLLFLIVVLFFYLGNKINTTEKVIKNISTEEHVGVESISQEIIETEDLLYLSNLSISIIEENGIEKLNEDKHKENKGDKEGCS